MLLTVTFISFPHLPVRQSFHENTDINLWRKENPVSLNSSLKGTIQRTGFLNASTNVTLVNNSTYLYSSPEEAMSNITAEIMDGPGSIINTVTKVRRTSHYLYDDILTVLKENETQSSLGKKAAVPGHKVYFSMMSKNHPNYTTQYKSQIVPVTAKEYQEETYGTPFGSTFLYGTFPLSSTSKNIGFSKGHNLLVYLNTSRKTASRTVLNETEELQQDCDLTFIDIANNIEASKKLSTEYQPDIVLDNHTKIAEKYNKSSSYFGVDGYSPAFVYVYLPSTDSSRALIWRKSLGFQSAKEILPYLEAFSKGFLKNNVGSNVYPILGINVENLEPNQDSDIYITLGTGFGEISSYEMKVSFYDQSGSVIGESNKTYSINKKTGENVQKRIVAVPEKDQKPKKLEIFVKVTSHDVSLSKKKVFKIQLEEEEPGRPWGVYIGIALTIVILIAGILLNRKYGKKSR